MTEKRKLVIVGAGEFAEIACDYFRLDSAYDVVAFAIDPAFRHAETLCDLPLIELDSLPAMYPPADHDVFVAVTYRRLNRVRMELFQRVKAFGYRCATYVSSRAFVWHNVTLGENVFIFENNVVQFHARIADNVVLWSGNHIGHRSVIERNVYLTSHVVVSGYCTIGENSFIGVNATIGDNVVVGRDCVIGAGSVILRNTEPERIYRGNPAQPASVSSLRAFRAR